MSIRLVEKGVDQRIHSRGDISHPDKKVNEVIEMLAAVVLTDGDQHIGDEERTPHDQEEKEHNPQDFGGSSLIVQRLNHASSALGSWTLWGLVGGGLTVQQTGVTYLDRRMFGPALALLRERSAVPLEITEREVIADHHDDQRNEEGHGRANKDETRLVQGAGAVNKHLLLVLETHYWNGQRQHWKKKSKKNEESVQKACLIHHIPQIK